MSNSIAPLPATGAGGVPSVLEFLFPVTGDRIRTIGNGDAVQFVLADVCAALDIRNSRDVAQRIPPAYVGSADIETLIGRRTVTVVSEPGLYEVVFRSDKPVAVLFREWVFAEVLPTIRRTGGYRLRQEPQASVEQQLLRTFADLRADVERLQLEVAVCRSELGSLRSARALPVGAPTRVRAVDAPDLVDRTAARLVAVLASEGRPATPRTLLKSLSRAQRRVFLAAAESAAAAGLIIRRDRIRSGRVSVEYRLPEWEQPTLGV